MRMRSKRWTDQELANNPHVIKDAEEKKGHWAEYFGNDHPIYIEVGCGKGNFICKNAEKYPYINFIGIEKQHTIIGIAARKAGDLPNLALIETDAKDLNELFEVGEFQRIYLNFSDPWPKRRNYKRRLTYREFLASYRALFGEKGEIFFKTDNRSLFEFSLEEFSADKWLLSHISLDLHHSPYAAENIMTEYEERFSSMGMPIYRLEARFGVEPDPMPSSAVLPAADEDTEMPLAIQAAE